MNHWLMSHFTMQNEKAHVTFQFAQGRKNPIKNNPAIGPPRALPKVAII